MKGKEETTFKKTLIFKRTNVSNLLRLIVVIKWRKVSYRVKHKKWTMGRKMRLLNEVSLSIWDSVSIYYHNTCPRLI